MKNLFFVLCFFGVAAQAAQLDSAKYDAKSDKVLVDITYGGCNLELFTFSFGPCAESFPYQITATLDDSEDKCKAVKKATLELSLDEMKNCRPAHLTLDTVRGANRLNVFVPEQ